MILKSYTLRSSVIMIVAMTMSMMIVIGFRCNLGNFCLKLKILIDFISFRKKNSTLRRAVIVIVAMTMPMMIVIMVMMILVRFRCSLRDI